MTEAASTWYPSAREPADAPALALGTRVAEFEVKGVLGSGGFGIVYLAWDHALEREVALKEYMPGALAGRGSGLAVSVRSQAHTETFALGLRSFVNEARMLARFDHPSLVKVYRFWEDNGTAYMVMPRYPGRTLRQVRAGMLLPPGEGACRKILDALLSALAVLHKEGVYHRDIAPDNILLGDDGAPVLLDFGAARRVIGEGHKALTSIMKPHFAPLEQYADQSAMRQGPWTDLYALGGTIYFLITGREPVPAASRALHDDQPRLADDAPAGFAPHFLAALDWMLALKPVERPQGVQMLRDVLEGRMAVPPPVAERTAPGVAAVTSVDILTSPGDLVADEAAAAPAGDPRTMVMRAPAPAQAAAAPQTAPPVAAAPAAAAPQRRALLPLLALLVLLNILAWWWFTRSDRGAPAKAASSAAAPVNLPAPPKAAPAAAPPPAPQPAASSALATAAAPAAASASTPGNETILSVLPARVQRTPAVRAADAASAALVRVPAGDAASAARPNAEAASQPAAAPRPRAVAAAPPPTGAAELQGPRARCGERNFLSLLICMKRECESASLRSHPECVKMREQEDAQQSGAR